MAITQIQEPADTNPVTQDWQDALNKLTLQTKGLDSISISNFDNDLEPEILAGSIFENNGAYFFVSVNESISGWTGISDDTVCYIKYNETSNIFEFTETVPTFDSDKGAYYDVNDRYFFRLYRDNSITYYSKQRIGKNNDYDHIIKNEGEINLFQVIARDETPDVPLWAYSDASDLVAAVVAYPQLRKPVSGYWAIGSDSDTSPASTYEIDIWQNGAWRNLYTGTPPNGSTDYIYGEFYNPVHFRVQIGKQSPLPGTTVVSVNIAFYATGVYGCDFDRVEEVIWT